MFRKIILLIGAVLLLIMLGGFLLPSSFSAKRSVTVQAPPEAVYDTLLRIQTWPQWHFWLQQADTDSKGITFGDTLNGKGASVASSKGKSSSTSIRIVSTQPMRKKINVNMTISGRFTLQSKISLEPNAQGARVVWQDRGNVGMNPVQRYIGLMMPSFLGDGIEESLSQLKRTVERRSDKNI